MATPVSIPDTIPLVTSAIAASLVLHLAKLVTSVWVPSLNNASSFRLSVLPIWKFTLVALSKSLVGTSTDRAILTLLPP
ncbi:hypothetical protein D3C71_2050800 [compost metagenome]